MLKGKATIQVVNEDTKEEKIYESENIVTNASQSISCKSPFYCKNITKGAEGARLLGGIMLFQNQVPNASANRTALHEMPVMWAGSQTSSTSGRPEVGKRISNIDKRTETGVKFKWNWLAGNTYTINSICLGLEDTFSSQTIGQVFNKVVGTQTLSGGFGGIPFKFDIENDVMYTYERPGFTKYITIRKYYRPVYKRCLFNYTNTFDSTDVIGRFNPDNILLDEVQIDVSFLKPSYVSYSGVTGHGFSYDTQANTLCIYKVFGVDNSTSKQFTNTVLMIIIDLDTFEIKQQTSHQFSSQLGSTYYLISQNKNLASSSETDEFTSKDAILIHNNYAYFKLYNGSTLEMKGVLKVNLFDTTDYQVITYFGMRLTMPYGLGTGVTSNGVFYDFCKNAYAIGYVIECDKAFMLNGQRIDDTYEVGTSLCDLDDLFIINYNTNFHLLFNCMYLGTINNLDTPITISSNESITITYELYEE